MNREPEVIEMRLDGSFPAPKGAPVAVKIAGIALAICTVAGALTLAALVMWFVLWAIVALVPITLAAGAIAWIAYRYQVWRRGSPGAPREVFRRF